MIHLLPIPFIFVGVIIYMITDYFKFKLFKNISKVAIIIFSVLFIILTANYFGYKIPILTNLVINLFNI